MKIAMIGQKGIAPHAGGVERHVEEIGARLAEKGHQVDVFCRSRYTDKRGTWRGMNIIMKPAIHTKHLDAITHTFTSTLSCLDGRYDIVHYHALGPTTMSPLIRFTGSKIVSTCHGLDWKREKWGGFATTMLQMAEWPSAKAPHKLITVSCVLADYFSGKYGTDAVAIPNGFQVPDELTPADAITKKWKLSDGEGGNPYILFMARLVPEKGVHLLLEAFREVDTPVKLVIAGAASHSRDYVEKLYQMAQGDERIVFTGNVTGNIWSELISNALLFVLPSTLEGLPIALLEAMGHGRPCIASDIPENLEVLFPGEDEVGCGKPFTVGSTSALAESLGFALDHPGDMARMGLRARDMVQRVYNWDQIATQVEQVYFDLMRKS